MLDTVLECTMCSVVVLSSALLAFFLSLFLSRKHKAADVCGISSPVQLGDCATPA